MGTIGLQRQAHARNTLAFLPTRQTGDGDALLCLHANGFLALSTYLVEQWPRVRCICNKVWEWCPICILNMPTDTRVHAVSAAVRAQHSRTQPDRQGLLFHYQIGLLGLCHSFAIKLPSKCMAKQDGNVKCVEGNCLDLHKLSAIIMIEQMWKTWKNYN